MELEHLTITPYHFHAQPSEVLGIINIHLPYHQTSGTWYTHPILHGQVKFPGMDVHSVILPIQRENQLHSLKMFFSGTSSLDMQK